MLGSKSVVSVQSAGLRAQVEAEEMFKLVSRLQNP